MDRVLKKYYRYFNNETEKRSVIASYLSKITTRNVRIPTSPWPRVQDLLTASIHLVSIIRGFINLTLSTGTVKITMIDRHKLIFQSLLQGVAVKSVKKMRNFPKKNKSRTYMVKSQTIFLKLKLKNMHKLRKFIN